MKKDSPLLKNKVKDFKEKLCSHLKEHTNIHHTTDALVNFIDQMLIQIFHDNQLENNAVFCLLALGSYGRRELQLHSDIDILILHDENISSNQLLLAQSFIQQCWDAGLEISHQLTTVSACANLAAQDISVISSLMDMHLICGKSGLMEELIYQIHPLHMWSSKAFFHAKKQEQKRRYKKYGETAYHLEPNVKSGSGGLRDLQLLQSIAKRHFNIQKLSEGINYGFITDKEYEEFLVCQNFLWRVRFALHYLAGKKEDRLLFDYQSRLAEFFGYKDQPHSLAIEQFMKIYFKIIKRNRELTDMLLQWFSELIVDDPRQKLISLDDDFQLSNQYIEVKYARCFQQFPQSILRLFFWISKNPDIRGVRASTIRLIRKSLYLINKKFKNDKQATGLFMQILHAENPYPALQCMSRYGVLARYLEAFSTVTGQMQYDLFHVYTVDQHTLFVIRNISRFHDARYQENFQLCAKVIKKINKPALLYLAALFHDIAKGRGGDHSELGALEAEQFAKRHQLTAEDTALLCWLVRHHLLMSITTQRKDIYDPETITGFCALLPDASHLDYLYLLTVADICATNPKLWNAWKDSLLKELYKSAEQYFKQAHKIHDEHTEIKLRQHSAEALLLDQGISTESIHALWKSFKGKYFLHEPPEIIARHTKDILAAKAYPLIMIHPHHSQGGTEIMIYMPHRDDRFVISTTVLSNLNMTIQEAVITTCRNQFDLDTYIVLDEQDKAWIDDQKIKLIRDNLKRYLIQKSTTLPKISQKRLSRTYNYFKFTPKIVFSDHKNQRLTSLFLISNDKPGLLASISRVFFKNNIQLHNAKIATAGERVEDMFYISCHEGKPLSPAAQAELKSALLKVL